MTQRLIVLHLEAAEPSLIEQWCEEGKLPHINKIKQQGSYGRLDPPGYIDSGCVWPTFSTGTNPGKHGMGFYPRQLQTGTYSIIKKYATDLIGEHFWETIDKAGKEVIVMDMPLTYPKKDFLGKMICNWGDEHASYKASSNPPELIQEILEKYGQNKLNDWYQNSLLSKEEWKELGETIIEAIQLRTQVVLDLISANQWELAVLNFGEIHWAGHMAWHLHDPSHPEYDQDIANHCGDILFNSYAALDESLGKIINSLPKDTNLCMMSALGMGAQVGGEMLLNEILEKLGLTPETKEETQGIFSSIKKKLLPGKLSMTSAVQQTEKIFSPKLMMAAKKVVPTKMWDKWTRRFLDLGNSRAKSKAFQVPGDHSGLIRINLKGREPKGLIQPGKEYNELCDFIIRELKQITDPQDGSFIVKDVVKIQNKLSGDMIDHMPDLAVIWRENKIIEKIQSPTFGTITNKEYHKRSGGHINSGFWIISGPDFPSGKTLPEHNLLDVAPTILKYFDVAIDQNLDGKWVDQLFVQETAV